MATTNAFFAWFLFGLGGNLGGWFIFMLLGMAAVIWMMYDSGTRRLPALGWKMAIILTALLIVPVMLYRFTTDNRILIDPLFTDPSPLAPYREPLFYLGVLGGLLPVVLAIGYYVTFQGMKGCPRGLHGAYEAVLGGCPGCAILDNPPQPQQQIRYEERERREERTPPPPPRPVKRKVQAWLVGAHETHALCEGETTIGRQASNDIYVTGDSTVSRQHAKIIQQGAHYKLLDLSGKGTTRINGRSVREPVLLETDDEVKLGDNTVFHFKK